MSSGNKVLRKSKEEIKKEFEEYKKAEKLDKETLKNLLSHCDVIPEIIESYLNILQKEDKNLFLEELLIYYPILPVDICQKFNVKKTESEKDRFFKLIKKLIDIKDSNIGLIRLLKNEIMNHDEIKHLIPKEELEKEIRLREEEIKKRIEKKKKLNQNKELEELEKEYLIPFKYSRWSINYCTSMDYKTEDNEEFLFYHLSNCLISEFLKDQLCFKKRIELMSIIIDSIDYIYSRRKQGQKFDEAFNFLCLALTNCEIKPDNKSELIPIIESIFSEMGARVKYMNLDEIKEYLNEKNYQCEIKDKQIIINYESNNFFIDNYNLYNLNKGKIEELLSNHYTYKTVLKNNMNING